MPMALKNGKGFRGGDGRESRGWGGRQAQRWEEDWGLLGSPSRSTFSPPTSSLFPTFPLLRAQSTCCRD